MEGTCGVDTLRTCDVFIPANTAFVSVCWRSPGQSKQTPGLTDVSPDGLPRAGKEKRRSLGQADRVTEWGDSSCLCAQHDKCGNVTTLSTKKRRKSRRGRLYWRNNHNKLLNYRSLVTCLEDLWWMLTYFILYTVFSRTGEWKIYQSLVQNKLIFWGLFIETEMQSQT